MHWNWKCVKSAAGKWYVPFSRGICYESVRLVRHNITRSLVSFPLSYLITAFWLLIFYSLLIADWSPIDLFRGLLKMKWKEPCTAQLSPEIWESSGPKSSPPSVGLALRRWSFGVLLTLSLVEYSEANWEGNKVLSVPVYICQHRHWSSHSTENHYLTKYQKLV